MVVGIVTSVEARTLGSELLTAANVGDTLLNVDMADHFDEDGGYLLLNDAVLAYVSVDPDADTITLASPLAVAAAADDFVAMWDAGKAAVEWVADVAVDDGDTIPAVIPTSLIPYFPEGTYDDAVSAEIRLVNDEYQVAAQPQREPSFDGSAVWNPHAALLLPAAVSIPDSTWTPVASWTVSEIDGLTLTGGSVGVIYGAAYSLQATAQWQLNPTGRRAIRLMVDGASVQIFITGGESDGTTYTPVFDTPRINELSVVTVQLYQNSGASLQALTAKLNMFRVSS